MAAPIMTGAVGRDDAFDARVLAAHNRERGTIGVPAIVWDTRLANEAKNWAGELARSGRFEHSRVKGQGENLWIGTNGRFSPEAMVGLWVAEKADFRPGVFPAVSRKRDWTAVGHYTQMIWRRTDRVGCGVAGNGRDEVLVCRYAEPGNVVGERPI